MAILKYTRVVEQVEVPVEFQCDICNDTFRLEHAYDRHYLGSAEKQMAVVKYGYPSGMGGQEVTKELHCCSPECLCEAIKKIPCDAKITIPVSGRYHDNRERR